MGVVGRRGVGGCGEGGQVLGRGNWHAESG